MTRPLRAGLLACLLAASVPAHAADLLHGFRIGGEPINPVCIARMRPWDSDRDILVKSIVLEACQASNWAFHPGPMNVDGDTVSVDAGESLDRPFAYRVLGLSRSGLHALYHEGQVAVYRISARSVQPDLLTPDRQVVHVLTAVAQAWVPCFDAARIEGDVLVIRHGVEHPEAPPTARCGPQQAVRSVPLRP